MTRIPSTPIPPLDDHTWVQERLAKALPGWAATPQKHHTTEPAQILGTQPATAPVNSLIHGGFHFRVRMLEPARFLGGRFGTPKYKHAESFTWGTGVQP